MTPHTWLHVAAGPALTLLPAHMDSQAARAMMVAICLQESRLEHRNQLRGPARSYAQFELGGMTGVQEHPASSRHLHTALEALDYADLVPVDLHHAMEHNDVLGAVFTRLLLWTLPRALPMRDDPDEAWSQYLECWRPGKPHPETWNELYAQAWETVADQ